MTITFAIHNYQETDIVLPLAAKDFIVWLKNGRNVFYNID